MSVQAPTTPATSAAPQQQTAPQQPWVATGLTYYHNQYVQRAADLGCCGVTHLLILEDSSLPATIGKIAIFAIASVGFAIYDVLHAVWEKISCNRSVVAVTPSANNTAPNANASSTNSSQDPTKSKGAKGKDDVSDAEETTGSSVDLDELTTEFDLADPKATEASIKANYELLKSAIEELRAELVKRPETAAIQRAIAHLEIDLNSQSSEIQRMLDQDWESIKGFTADIAKIQNAVKPLTTQVTGAMNIMRLVAPELTKQVEAQVQAQADAARAKGKKSSAKATDPADDASGPDESEKASKKASKQSENAKPLQKFESKHESDDSDDEVVSPFIHSDNLVPPPVQPLSSENLQGTYAKLKQETSAIGEQLGLSYGFVIHNCNPMGQCDFSTEISRLDALKAEWTHNLYTKILDAVNGIKVSATQSIQTSQSVREIYATHHTHEARLEHLRRLTDQVALIAETKLREEIVEKAPLHDFTSLNAELDKKHTLSRLLYLKEVVRKIDEELAKQPQQPAPTPTPIPPGQGS